MVNCEFFVKLIKKSNLSRVRKKRFILEVKNGIININFRVYTGFKPWMNILKNLMQTLII